MHSLLCTYASARKPSNLTSYVHPSPCGTLFASDASIGRYVCPPAYQSEPSASLRLISSQFCSLPSMCVGRSDHVPRSRVPCSSNVSWPFGFSSSSSYVPLSQISTVPPPYWPFGISPSNLPYSSGWSSTWTASTLSPGASGTPFGTAQEASAPFRSRRKS